MLKQQHGVCISAGDVVAQIYPLLLIIGMRCLMLECIIQKYASAFITAHSED